MSYANTLSTGETSSPGPLYATPNLYNAPQGVPNPSSSSSPVYTPVPQAASTQPLYSLPPPPAPMSEHVSQFQRLLWASLALPLGSLICSLIYLGALSFWVTPIAFLFTTIFNIILIVMVRKERGRPPADGRSVVAEMGTLVCAWILAVVWFIAFAIVLGVSISLAVLGRVSSGRRRVVVITAGGYVEALFDITLVGVMAALAVRSFRERKASAAAGGVQMGAYPQQQQQQQYTGQSQTQQQSQYTGQSQVQQQQSQYPPQMQQQYPAQMQQQQYPAQQQQQQYPVQQQYPMQQQQYPSQMQAAMQQAPPGAMQVQPSYPTGRAIV